MLPNTYESHTSAEELKQKGGEGEGNEFRK